MISLNRYHRKNDVLEQKDSSARHASLLASTLSEPEKLQPLKNLKDYVQQVFTVGAIKVLPEDEPPMLNPLVKHTNPDFVSPEATTLYILRCAMGDGEGTFLQRFLNDEFTKHLPPTDKIDLASLFDTQSYLKRFEEHMYAVASDAKKERSMENCMLHHCLDDHFKSFMEFTRSILEFLLREIVLLKLEAGQLIPIEGDFPEFDRQYSILLQGDGTGRRTLEHLALLFELSARPDQVAYIMENFEFFAAGRPLMEGETSVPSAIWLRLAKASQKFIKIAGRFHMKYNFFTDGVDAWKDAIYKPFFLLVTKKSSCGDVASMKSRIKINLAEGLGAGWFLTRDEMLPFMTSPQFAGNMTMSALLYYFEGPLTMATVFYDILFRSGKCNEQSFEVMCCMMVDSFLRLRHNYPGLFIESIDQYLYWKRAHPSLNKFIIKWHHVLDEICIEGGINAKLAAICKNCLTEEEAIKAIRLAFSSRMDGSAQALRNTYLIDEKKCKNPLGKNIDELAKHAASHLVSIIFQAAEGPPGVRVPDRRTKVIADSIKLPSLFPGMDLKDVPKMHANVCLSPGWTLFPDRKYSKGELAATNRACSDAPDGFRAPSGCNMRTCTSPKGTLLRSIYCGHIICTECKSGSVFGYCDKCKVEIELGVLSKAQQRQRSRRNKFVRPEDLHLSKCGSDTESGSDEGNEDADDDDNAGQLGATDRDGDDDSSDPEEVGHGEQQKQPISASQKKLFINSLDIGSKITAFQTRPLPAESEEQPSVILPAVAVVPTQPQMQLTDVEVGTRVMMMTARSLTGICTYAAGQVIAICPSEGVLFHVKLDSDAPTRYHAIQHAKQIKLVPSVPPPVILQPPVTTPQNIELALADNGSGPMEIDEGCAEVLPALAESTVGVKRAPEQDPEDQPQAKRTRNGREYKPPSRYISI